MSLQKKKMKVEKKYKKYILSSWLFLVLGIFLFGIGGFKFFYIKPQIAIDLMKQQPLIKNGTVELVIGFGLYAIGLYRLLDKEKYYSKMKENLEEKDKMERLQKKKNSKGFKKKYGY